MLCGYAEASGAQRWCIAGGAGPAYAAGQVAFAVAGGGSASVDAIDGSRRWRRPRSRDEVEPAGVVDEVWATASDFLVRRLSRDVAEISPSGEALWTARIEGNRNPLIVEPFAFFTQVGDGAMISVNQHVVRSGRGGGAGFDVDAWQIAAVEPPYAFVTYRPGEETQDHIYTIDVGRADLRSGSIDQHFHFEPDYDANSASYYRTGILDGADTAQAPVRFDGARFYTTIAHTVYRYDFAEPRAQHPLLVARDAQLLGGPFRGAIFVARRGGVWSMRQQQRTIYARLVAPSTAEVVNFTIAGQTAFVAFGDGSVRGFDAQSGRVLLDAKPCDTSHDIRIGASRHHAFVVCASGSCTRVFAFAFGVAG